MRGAFLHTRQKEGTRTLNDLMSGAVMTEVKRLEDKYNGGRPFPSVESGVLPVGRRVEQ